MAFLDCIHHTSSTLMQNINVSRCNFIIQNNQVYHNVQIKDPKPTLELIESCKKLIDEHGNFASYIEHVKYPIISSINNLNKHSSWDSIRQIFNNLYNFFIYIYRNVLEHKLLNSTTKYDTIKDFCKFICFVSYDTHENNQYHLSFLYRHLLMPINNIKKNKEDRLTKNFLLINEVFYYLIFRKSNQLANQITPCGKTCKLKKLELYLININVLLLHNIYCSNTNEKNRNKIESNKLICKKYSKIFNSSSSSTDSIVNQILL